MPVSWWDGEKYAKKRVVVDGELIDAHALEYGADSDDVAKRYHAQVIDATLGRGACHDKNSGCSDEYTHGFECTVCEATTDSYMHITTSDEDEPFNFCPNCGRRVKR